MSEGNGKDRKWANLSDEEKQAWIDRVRAEGKCGAAPHPTAARQWPCQKPGDGAGGRCRRHGGKSPGRPIKHGKYSTAAPVRIRRILQECLNDPGILDLTDTLALFDVRIRQLLERLDETDCPDYRTVARQRFAEARAAAQAGDSAKLALTMQALGDWLERGEAESEAWTTLLQTASDRSKRAEAAATVALRGEQSVMARDLVVLIGNMVDVMLDECGVEHRALAQRISARWERDVMQPKQLPRDVEHEETSEEMGP